MKTLIAVPMKAYADAKTRLSGELDSRGRQRLAKVLFEYGQAFFSENYPRLDRLVVTPSSEVARAARRAGASALREPVGTVGLNAAVAMALSHARLRRYDRLIVLPADLAILKTDEFDALLALADRYDLVMARAHDGGTNALLLKLPNAFTFCYGADSARRHLHQALELGMSAVAASLPFIGLDVDSPGDRAEARRIGVGAGAYL